MRLLVVITFLIISFFANASTVVLMNSENQEETISLSYLSHHPDSDEKTPYVQIKEKGEESLIMLGTLRLAALSEVQRIKNDRIKKIYTGTIIGTVLGVFLGNKADIKGKTRTLAPISMGLFGFMVGGTVGDMVSDTNGELKNNVPALTTLIDALSALDNGETLLVSVENFDYLKEYLIELVELYGESL